MDFNLENPCIDLIKAQTTVIQASIRVLHQNLIETNLDWREALEAFYILKAKINDEEKDVQLKMIKQQMNIEKILSPVIEKMWNEVKEKIYEIETEINASLARDQKIRSIQAGPSTSNYKAEFLNNFDEAKIQIKDLTMVKKLSPEMSLSTNRNSFDFSKISMVPKFDGEMDKFADFWKAFQIYVDNTDANENVKMFILQAVTEGEPKKIINRCRSYMEMVKELCSKYKNSRNLIDYYLENLLNVPKIEDLTHYSKLKLLTEKVREILNVWHNVGFDQSTAFTIRKIIIQKLPPNFAIRISRLNPIDDIVKLLQILNDILKYARIYNQPLIRELNYRTSESIDLQPMTAICSFCNGPHLTIKCDSNKTQIEKQEIVRLKGLCRLCLRAGHKLADCRSNYRCVCGSRHSLQLCKKFSPAKNKTHCLTNLELTNIDSNENNFEEINLRTDHQITTTGKFYSKSNDNLQEFYDFEAERKLINEQLSKELGESSSIQRNNFNFRSTMNNS